MKQIWDILEVTREGTNQVKESKINLITHPYELFKRDSDGNIRTYFLESRTL